MGILDKAKQQAQGLKEKVGDKVEDVQAKRKTGDLLEALGRLVYAERTGRPSPDASVESDRLVGELQSLENEGVTVLATSPPATDTKE